MKFKVTKSTLKMVNGDKQIIKDEVITSNVEDYREQLHAKYECKSIILVYEEYPDTENAAPTPN